MLLIFRLKVRHEVMVEVLARPWFEQLPFVSIRWQSVGVEYFPHRRRCGAWLSNGDVEVDRALDNLTKSGKLFAPPSRRESMPMIGGPRPYSDFGMS